MSFASEGAHFFKHTLSPELIHVIFRFLIGAASVVGSLLDENIGDVSAKKFTAGEESDWSSSCIQFLTS